MAKKKEVKMASSKGLYSKYGVFKLHEPSNEVSSPSILKSANTEDVDAPFVLFPRKDPAAFMAMVRYAQICDPQLSNDINMWLAKIALSKPEYGTQGARNLTQIRMLQISGL